MIKLIKGLSFGKMQLRGFFFFTLVENMVPF